MQSWPVVLVGILARIAAFQLLTWLILQWGLKRFRLDTPEARRLACLAVLVQGCLFIPWTVSIPWYDPPAIEAGVASVGSPLPKGLAGGDRMPSLDPAQPIQQNPSEPNSTAYRGAIAGLNWTPRTALRLACVAAVAVWLAGIVAIVASMLFSYARFLLAVPWIGDCPDKWQKQWRELLAERRIRRRIPLVSTERHGPMLCLLPWGYSILVPRSLWKQSTPSQRAFVLRHEIAHYERGDVWKSWLIMMLAIPNWFNPVAWRAVRSCLESAELACDRAAARSPEERVEYARLLQQLIAMHLPVHPAGRSAHSHPLVSRVCYLVSPSEEENSTMRKTLLIAVLGSLLIVHAVRVQLVAQDGPTTRQAAEQRIAELDKMLTELGEKVTKLEASGQEFVQEVETRTQKLKELADNHWNLGDEFQDRVALLQSGSETAELKALDGVEKLGDEGVLVLAFAADQSSHKAVRQKALAIALKIGTKAYPVIAHVFEDLSEEDRLFLVGEIAKTDAPQKMLVLASLSEDPSKKVRKAALDAGCKLKDKLAFVALYAKNGEQDPMVEELLEVSAKFKGDEGVMLLYAGAGSEEPTLVIGVLKEAAKRGVSALPVLKPAFENQDPSVRAQVVRTAKKMGGPVADFVIDLALNDPDPKLREAAEKAFQEKEEPEEDKNAEPAKADATAPPAKPDK